MMLSTQDAVSKIVVRGDVNTHSRFKEPPVVDADHELLVSLRQSTPFLDGHLRTKQFVLRGYDDACKQLAVWKEQVIAFVQRMLEAGTDFNGNEAVPGLPRAVTDLLTEFYHFRFSTSRNIKTLALLDEATPSIYRKLRDRHETDLRAFVGELVGLFDAMQARGVVGSVRWAESGEHCEYTYFRSRVTGTSKPRQLIKSTSRLSGLRQEVDQPGWWRTKHVTNRFLHSGEFVFQHATYTQLLSFVQSTPLTKWTLPLPDRAVSTIWMIPPFLFSRATITTGHLEYGRIVARDVGRMPWQYTTEEVTEERVRHVDPMLAIGPWVVCGWCPDEHPVPTLSQRILARFAATQTAASFRQRITREDRRRPVTERQGDTP